MDFFSSRLGLALARIFYRTLRPIYPDPRLVISRIVSIFIRAAVRTKSMYQNENQ